MTGGPVPLVLLSVPIGLMLAFVPISRGALALAAFVAAALVGLAISPTLAPDLKFTALCLSAIAAAAIMFVPASRWSFAVVPVGLNAGFWFGASAMLATHGVAFLIGLLPVVCMIPARWLIHRRLDIVLKVVASWIIAIASLSLFVSLVPTPGYQPDHME